MENMENEEKNIEQNKELSLQEQLEAQDEFAFLDEEPIQENNEEVQQDVLSADGGIQEEVETLQEDKDSLDLFEASKEINNQDEDTMQEEVNDIQELQEEIEQTVKTNDDILDEEFEDFSDNEVDNELIEKPEIEPQSCVSFEDEIEETAKENPQSLITVRPVKFQEFENTHPNRTIKKNLDLIQDVSMHISVELGRTKSSIRQVMALEKASIVELDKIAGEQVEIFVNQKLVAKGEVIVIEDKFGVRVTSTTSPKAE